MQEVSGHQDADEYARNFQEVPWNLHAQGKAPVPGFLDCPGFQWKVIDGSGGLGQRCFSKRIAGFAVAVGELHQVDEVAAQFGKLHFQPSGSGGKAALPAAQVHKHASDHGNRRDGPQKKQNAKDQLRKPAKCVREDEDCQHPEAGARDQDDAGRQRAAPPFEPGIL